MRQKEKDIIRNKKLLMDVATAMFAKNGYHATKIDDIVNEAGFSKGTFYNYFKSKEAVLVEIVYEKSQIILDGIDVISELDIPLEEMLLKLNHRRQETFHKEHDFFKMVFIESMRTGKSVPKAMHERMHAFFAKTIEKFSKLFERYRSEFRDDLTSYEIAMVYMSIIDVNKKFVSNPEAHSNDNIIDSEKIISIFLNGVGKRN